VLRSCIDAATALTEDVVAENVHGGHPMPVPRWAPPTPNRTTTGHVEAMALYAGQGVGAVTAVVPAAGIVAELAGEPRARRP
jgi:hypothetical protein